MHQKMKSDLVANFFDMIDEADCYQRQLLLLEVQNRALPNRVMMLLRYVNALPNPLAWPLRNRIVSLGYAGKFSASRPGKPPRIPEEFLPQYEAGNRAISEVFFDSADLGLSMSDTDHSSDASIRACRKLAPRVRGWTS